MNRHEIPTHLHVEDRVLLGLTLRQVMHLIAGLAAGYGLWTHVVQWPQVPMVIRLAAVSVCFVAAVALALLRPYGRGLGDWTLSLAAYCFATRRSVWRPGYSPATEWSPAPAPHGDWQELAPQVAWGDPAPQTTLSGAYRLPQHLEAAS